MVKRRQKVLPRHLQEQSWILRLKVGQWKLRASDQEDSSGSSFRLSASRSLSRKQVVVQQHVLPRSGQESPSHQVQLPEEFLSCYSQSYMMRNLPDSLLLHRVSLVAVFCLDIQHQLGFLFQVLFIFLL